MKQRVWKAWELKYLRENYQHRTVVELAVSLDRTKASVKNQVYKMGFRKEHNITRFAPGHTPVNKGKKCPGYGGHTRFQKGNQPHNTLPPGVHKIKTKDGEFYKIKHADGKLEMYHHYLWKKEKGPIPRGYVVSFLNWNTLDCSLENLICISRADNLRRINKERTDLKTRSARVWRTRRGHSVVDAVLYHNL
jgi:hypothetical protein